MYERSKGLASYGRIANAETNQLQQIVLLYDGAIKFLRFAARDIEAGDIAAKAEHSNRALDIIGYLQSILDFEKGGDAAPTLDRLYASITRLTMRASITLDAAMMNQAADLLAPVRDSWKTISSSNNSSSNSSSNHSAAATPAAELATALNVDVAAAAAAVASSAPVVNNVAPSVPPTLTAAAAVVARPKLAASNYR